MRNTTLWHKGILVALLFIFLANSPAFANLPIKKCNCSQESFKVPPGLEPQVDFWIKIYSEYTTNHAVVHDMRHPDIIYEVVDLGNKKRSRRAKERKLNRVKSKYRTILRKLAKTKDKSKLSAEYKRIHDLVGSGFYKASRNIRVQIGQKDRFGRGLERSGLYIDKIRKIFTDYGLPVALSALPHVESSFNVGAYSSAGAAGIWQFTRSTGRLFMRVGYDVDERRDPILATYAAAKLLKKNYQSLQNWPLAITAYNHGLQGMRRAKKRHGPNIVRVINNYKSRTFGFASQNFYAEFLAALYVVQNETKYFPNLVKKKPLRMVSVKLDNYIHIKTAKKYFGMSRDEIAKTNPALRPPVLNGEKRIPKGFVFQARKEKNGDLLADYKKIPKSVRYAGQIRSKWYTVRRGDTLSEIAMRYRTRVKTLKQLNHIGRKNTIYVGKVLQLPGGGRGPAVRLAKAKEGFQYKTLGTLNYKVRRNDNLTKIAKRYRTTPRELIRLNGIKRPNSLKPGQRLKVPEKVLVAKAEKKTKSPSKTKQPVVQKAVKKEISEPKIVKAVAKEKVEPEEKIVLASASPKEFITNPNRPALIPVSFSSKKQKENKIGVIRVDFDETLSHYADWASLPVSKVRRANNLKKGRFISYNKKIRVPFTRVGPDKFEERRQEFHKAIQEDFFNNYQVSKLVVRNVEKGETLWEICNESYFIPFWLLHGYNPDKDIHTLKVGEPIVIPIIIPIKNKES